MSEEKVKSLDSMFEEFDKETKAFNEYRTNSSIMDLVKKANFFDSEKGNKNFKSVETMLMSDIMRILASKYSDLIEFQLSPINKIKMEHGLMAEDKIDIFKYCNFQKIHRTLDLNCNNNVVSKQEACRWISFNGDYDELVNEVPLAVDYIDKYTYVALREILLENMGKIYRLLELTEEEIRDIREYNRHITVTLLFNFAITIIFPVEKMREITNNIIRNNISHIKITDTYGTNCVLFKKIFTSY